MVKMRLFVGALLIGLCVLGYGIQAQELKKVTKKTGYELLSASPEATAVINQRIQMQNQADFKAVLERELEQASPVYSPLEFNSQVYVPASALRPGRRYYASNSNTFNLNLLPSTYPGSPLYFNKAYNSKPMSVPYQVARTSL